MTIRTSFLIVLYRHSSLALWTTYSVVGFLFENFEGNSLQKSFELY